jgi:hypothetical protein
MMDVLDVIHHTTETAPGTASDGCLNLVEAAARGPVKRDLRRIGRKPDRRRIESRCRIDLAKEIPIPDERREVTR